MHLTGTDVSDIFIVITILGASILYARNRIPQQNVKEQGELITTLQALRLADAEKTTKQLNILTDTYEKRIKALEDELRVNHQMQLDNVAAIAELQGQIKVYKELPLRELADSINKVVEISQSNADSNKKILQVLQQTATINAEDRDVLTNQNLHIKTEVDRVIGKSKGVQ